MPQPDSPESGYVGYLDPDKHLYLVIGINVFDEEWGWKSFLSFTEAKKFANSQMSRTVIVKIESNVNKAGVPRHHRLWIERSEAEGWKISKEFETAKEGWDGFPLGQETT